MLNNVDERLHTHILLYIVIFKLELKGEEKT